MLLFDALTSKIPPVPFISVYVIGEESLGFDLTAIDDRNGEIILTMKGVFCPLDSPAMEGQARVVLALANYVTFMHVLN